MVPYFERLISERIRFSSISVTRPTSRNSSDVPSGIVHTSVM